MVYNTRHCFFQTVRMITETATENKQGEENDDDNCGTDKCGSAQCSPGAFGLSPQVREDGTGNAGDCRARQDEIRAFACAALACFGRIVKRRSENERADDADQAEACGSEGVRAEVRRDARAHPLCDEGPAPAERAAAEGAPRMRGDEET